MVTFGVYWGDPLGAERRLAQRLSELGDAEREVLFGDEVAPGEIVERLGIQGLFSQARTLIVRRADPLARAAELAEALSAGPPPGTAVFFLGNDLSGPLAKLAQEAERFSSPSFRELRRLAATLLSEQGLPPREDLVEALVEACRGDTLRLAREVEKLSLWREEIEQGRDLSGLVTTGELTPYAFLDALGGGRVEAALGELRRLRGAGWDPLRLFFLLVSHLRALLATLAAWEDGRTPAGPEWLARRRLAQARRLGQGKLIELLARLQELDHAIKTGALKPWWALELFTLELAP